MRNKKFDRIKKTLAILLVLCFVLSVTAASVSADDSSKYGKNKEDFRDDSNNYGKNKEDLRDDSHNYGKNKEGFREGYQDGYKDGKTQGQKDCEKYGIKEIIQKIPTPFNKYSWTKYSKENYNEGYKRGYLEGYSKSRYTCLKKWIILLAISGKAETVEERVFPPAEIRSFEIKN